MRQRWNLRGVGQPALESFQLTLKSRTTGSHNKIGSPVGSKEHTGGGDDRFHSFSSYRLSRLWPSILVNTSWSFCPCLLSFLFTASVKHCAVTRSDPSHCLGRVSSFSLRVRCLLSVFLYSLLSVFPYNYRPSSRATHPRQPYAQSSEQLSSKGSTTLLESRPYNPLVPVGIDFYSIGVALPQYHSVAS